MKRLIRLYHKSHHLIIFLAILIPLSLSLVLILSVNLTFWNDNARDLLSSWNNLTKLTLVGPPSGIPGIFYGPYWIWLLSFGLLFSKNPLLVTIITATIPYFILFPLLWFRFNKFFDFTSLLTGWLLFIFSSGMTYATQLWNLYPAPLITLTIIYLLMIAEFTTITKKQTILALVMGFLLGLLINFDISFGIALVFGTAIYFIIYTIYTVIKSNKNIRQKYVINTFYSLANILVGFMIAFLPSILFEKRHGFHQTQVLLHTLFKYGAVLQVQGLNKMQILQMFIKTFGNLLQLSVFLAGIILTVSILFLIFQKYNHKIKFQPHDVRILFILFSLFAGTLFIYLSAKNPVWEYHFIGVDILSLLLLVFLASKLPIFRKSLLIYTIVIVCLNVAIFIINFHSTDSHFEQQVQVVNIIIKDAKHTNYTVYSYNRSIYTYEYSYLFKWMAHKDVPYDPGMIKSSTNIIYLIIPMNNNAYVQDFINFRSQAKRYKKVYSWKTQNAYIILKYIKR
jgi:hypothetical protein